MAELKLTYQISDNHAAEADAGSLLFNSQLVSNVHHNTYDLKYLLVYGQDLLLSIPLVIKTGLPGKRLIMPQYVPYFDLSPQHTDNNEVAKDISFEQKLMAVVAEALNSLKCSSIEINILPVFWLPFHWAGFTVKPRITYRLSTTSEIDELFSNLRNNIQRHIKKSEKLHQLHESNDAQLLFDLNKASYHRKNDKHPFDLLVLQNLCKYLFETNSGRLLVATNGDGKTIAAALFGMDKNHVYYLTGGVLTEHKAEGAMSHLLWQGILWAKSNNRNFDFEGSMNQNIATFFASFGAEPFTYFQISKSNSKVYNLYKTLQS
jgi:hypothetical protein